MEAGARELCATRLNVPLGWHYNPSGPNRRIPIALAAAVTSLLATLSLRPDSIDASRLPVASAALLAGAASSHALAMAFAGDGARWHRAPWTVLLSTAAASALAALGVLRLALQPISRGANDNFGISAAALGIILFGPAADELLATLQHLKRRVDSGERVWLAVRGTRFRRRSEIVDQTCSGALREPPGEASARDACSDLH